MPKEPEQLQFELGRIDPVSQEFPRRHHERQIRTVGEVVTDAVQYIDGWLVRNPSAEKASYYLMAASVIAVSSYVLGGRVEEIEQQSEGIYAPVDENDLIECTEGVAIDPDEFVYDEEFNYGEMYDRVAVATRLDWSIYAMDLQYSTDKSIQEHAENFQEFFGERGVNVEFKLDFDDEAIKRPGWEDFNGTITQSELLNLATALQSIPKSLYEKSGVKKIQIIDEIKRKKSNSRLQIESEVGGEPIEQIDEYRYAGGDYSIYDDSVRIVRGSLFDREFTVDFLWHEVVGHGVMRKICDPLRDRSWFELNKSSGIEVVYKPVWMRTREELNLLNSQVIVRSAYAGKNELEDEAVTTAMLSPFGGLNYQGTTDPDNGSIVDEKLGLIANRLNEVEPDLARFLAMYYQMSISGSEWPA